MSPDEKNYHRERKPSRNEVSVINLHQIHFKNAPLTRDEEHVREMDLSLPPSPNRQWYLKIHFRGLNFCLRAAGRQCSNPSSAELVRFDLTPFLTAKRCLKFPPPFSLAELPVVGEFPINLVQIHLGMEICGQTHSGFLDFGSGDLRLFCYGALCTKGTF
jgi:hypothetical protein